MRFAIVGSGISGLVCAHLLAPHHDVTVFEAGDHVGGHTNTVDVEVGGERHAVDTGFIVFNDWTYPNFIRLLTRLGVESQPTSMSFSVRCDQSGVEYSGMSLNRMFAQRLNVFRPGFHRLLRDIFRFNREAPALVANDDGTTTLGEFLRKQRYSDEFVGQYLVPLGSAIWSCPAGTLLDFPVRFLVNFYHNHGMLSVRHRPTWRVVRGGSRTYVERLIRPFRERIRLRCPVRSVTRLSDHVRLDLGDGTGDTFDHVILACHSDQALALLGDPDDRERDLLGAFRYQRNEVVLHTDTGLLPRKKLAWASWNYHVRREPGEHATVTYWMNLLQGLTSGHNFCVTLNETESIDPTKILRRFVYHHPVYTTRQAEAHQRRHEMVNVRRTSFCGAYWGNGFHEDGVNSALDVCKHFGQSL